MQSKKFVMIRLQHVLVIGMLQNNLNFRHHREISGLRYPTYLTKGIGIIGAQNQVQQTAQKLQRFLMYYKIECWIIIMDLQHVVVLME